MALILPVKDKSGFENLYLIEAFKICYPEYKDDFGLGTILAK